jgi:hypothetical protein
VVKWYYVKNRVESKGCKRMTPTGGELEADTFNVI